MTPAPGQQLRCSQLWSQLSGARSQFMQRAERLAALTLPRLCLPDGVTQENAPQTHDYQSLGAAAVNHLNNRVMLSLFRPGDPFFRLDLGKTTKKKLAGQPEMASVFDTALAQVENDAVSVLDRRAIRPKLYQAGRHLIALGNALLQLDETPRVYGLRHYCVKRTADGREHTIVIREQLKFNELSQDVQAAVTNKQPDTTVCHYRVIELQPAGNYTMRQAVDDVELTDPKFAGNWPADKKPYHALTWDLADESDYGTGLVEEYMGDFEGLSALSESLLDGSVLGTEMRWLVNPGGVTALEAFKRSVNGDAVAGQKGDVEAIFGGNAQALEIAVKVVEMYSQRIARGFLLQSAMVRNAERVTAEEIRQLALELETAFGGTYSQLGINWQRPVALWCLADLDLSLLGTDIDLTVITGLDALTRNAQLEKLRAAMGDLALFESLPEGLKVKLNWVAIADFVGKGRGVDLRPFILTPKQIDDKKSEAVADSAAAAAGQTAGEAIGQQAAQGVQ